MEEEQTHILIIDDHQLIIDGLENVLHQLSTSIKITHSQNAADILEQLIAGQEYDLILVDIGMPTMDGFSFLTAIREHNILVPVAVISATEDIADVQKVLDKGALGFISKSSNSDELLSAVSLILEGNVYTPPWYTPIDSSSDDPRIIQANQLNISRRQLDVLDLLATGNSNKQIANTLFLSEDTIKSHIKALFNNFDASNRTECLNAARRRGVLKDVS